jgi:hypothetical protein
MFRLLETLTIASISIGKPSQVQQLITQLELQFTDSFYDNHNERGNEVLIAVPLVFSAFETSSAASVIVPKSLRILLVVASFSNKEGQLW